VRTRRERRVAPDTLARSDLERIDGTRAARENRARLSSPRRPASRGARGKAACTPHPAPSPSPSPRPPRAARLSGAFLTSALPRQSDYARARTHARARAGARRCDRAVCAAVEGEGVVTVIVTVHAGRTRVAGRTTRDP